MPRQRLGDMRDIISAFACRIIGRQEKIYFK